MKPKKFSASQVEIDVTLSELARGYRPSRAAYEAGQMTFVGFVVGGPYEDCFVHVGTWKIVPRWRFLRRRHPDGDKFGGYFADFSGTAKHHDESLDYTENPLGFDQMDDFLRQHDILWAAPDDVDAFALAYLPHITSRFRTPKPRTPNDPLPNNWPDPPVGWDR
jgi:hypothetical protein